MDRRNRPQTLPCTFEETHKQLPHTLELTQDMRPVSGKSMKLPSAPNIASLPGNWRASTTLWSRVNATANAAYVARETVMYKLSTTINPYALIY